MAKTAKAEQTSRQILETALELFTSNGYEETTMREIAEKADCSLGLAYRYYANKQALVLELYRQMADETAAYIEQLPQDTIANRFHLVMVNRLKRAEPYRDALGALYSAAMNPNSESGLLGDNAANMRETALEAFVKMVETAKDAPKGEQARHIATLLYTLHFLFIQFWLYDRTAKQRVSYELLDFTNSALKQMRMLILLPNVAQSLAKLSKILAEIFVPTSAL
jgi:AcrR family transcriptional regulator